MRTHIYDVFSAATPTNRELRFYSSGATHTKRELRFFPFSTGRPLFAILAMLGAAIGITILLFQGEHAEYEPYRGQSVQGTGKIYNLEPRRQEDTIVWRMGLSNGGKE